MAKPKTLYVCNACGAESSQWFGKCPACGTYNSLDEVAPPPPVKISRGGWQSNTYSDNHDPRTGPAQPRSSLTFSEIVDTVQIRFPSGYGELDRVLGGGIVPGSLVLIGGDPGIGKSTLMLQVANQLAKLHRILYVCAEESGQQVKLRASRLGVVSAETPDQQSNNGRVKKEAKSSKSKSSKSKSSKTPIAAQDSDSKSESKDADLYILPETDLEEILRELESLKPQVAVIDSIQTLYFPALTSAPGSVAQVRECTSALMQVAKRSNITLLIVGHVTKEGAIAGPRVLEHLV
ncbi:MAG: AAA family ATPase, partial [Moorea sp. SIO3G5]|nr:AAA family ATPase [Moorena sp. SIO3G5]